MRTPTFEESLTLLAMSFGLWNAVRMMRRPQSYVGVGRTPASDPRTVRQFGVAFAVLASVPIALTLFKIISE